MHSFQLNHGNPPFVDPRISTMKMKLNIQQALNRRYLLHGWEALALKTFIFANGTMGLSEPIGHTFMMTLNREKLVCLGIFAHTMIRTIVSGNVLIQAQLLCILVGSIAMS